MNAFVLQIRHPINEIGGQKGGRGDFDILSKKVKGKIYFENDEEKGERASMWSILGCRVVAQRTILIGPSPPVG